MNTSIKCILCIGMMFVCFYNGKISIKEKEPIFGILFLVAGMCFWLALVINVIPHFSLI